VGIGISFGVSGALAAIARTYPKEKAIALGNKLGDIVGLAITNFGNSRIGKKLWNKVEEGPITTVLAFLMAFFVHVGKKMVEDNYNVDISNAPEKEPGKEPKLPKQLEETRQI
jgi:hypothetical protein